MEMLLNQSSLDDGELSDMKSLLTGDGPWRLREKAIMYLAQSELGDEDLGQIAACLDVDVTKGAAFDVLMIQAAQSSRLLLNYFEQLHDSMLRRSFKDHVYRCVASENILSVGLEHHVLTNPWPKEFATIVRDDQNRLGVTKGCARLAMACRISKYACTHNCAKKHWASLSYVALIEREADYDMALRHGLLPNEVTWVAWLALVNELVGGSAQEKSFASDATSASSVGLLRGDACVNRRFHYGELRLGRLNWIYRIIRGEFRGYLSGCTNYGTFMRENTNSLITLFAYTTIVLSAMQVGLSTELLANDYAFGMASSVFSIFSILAPLVCIVAIMDVLAIIIIANLTRTLRIRRLKQSQGVKV